MSGASQTAKCVVCGQPLSADPQDCTGCGATVKWQDLIRATEFARRRFQEWATQQILGSGPAAAIAADFGRQQQDMMRMAKERAAIPAGTAMLCTTECWNCRVPLSAGRPYCAACGAPVDHPKAQSLRYWRYTGYWIKAYCDAGRLPLAQAHACMNTVRSRVAAMRTELDREREVVAAEVVAEKGPSASAEPPRQPNRAPSVAAAVATINTKVPPKPHRPLWEIMLDPHTIQWLLGLGGALFVLGLVIWLATLGIFKDPVVIAVALGIGNAAVLGGGAAMIRLTRYQTAGRAITLLACLIMPLNLWFYHANGLITLDGHLWAAALVCCVLYLASALVLRDHLFVYVFCGGIAMTAMLMLVSADRFWEIASPAALLVGLAIISIHIERAFPAIEGPFSRGRFGLAFFYSGQVLLAVGLLLILGAQVAGHWLYEPVFKPLYAMWHLGPPAVVAESWGRFLALALVLAGSYAYFYSDIIVRRVGLYVYMAVFTLLWAEILVIELVAVQITMEIAILAMALTALAANLLQPQLLRWHESVSPDEKRDGIAATAMSLVRAGQPLGLFLSTVPVFLGLMLHLRATYRPLNELWRLPDGGPFEVTWMYVLAMLATAVSCRVGAHLYRRTLPWLSSVYFFGMATTTLTGLAGFLSVTGIKTWDEMAPIVMVVPILYALAARLYRGHTPENPLMWAAHAATGVMVVAVLAAALHLTPAHVVEPVVGKSLNLLLAVFFAEAALFYGLAASFRKESVSVYCGTAMACGAIWQILLFCGVEAEYYTLTFAVLGLALLICYRLAVLEWTGLVTAAFQCANALMSLSFVGRGPDHAQPTGHAADRTPLVAGGTPADTDGAEPDCGLAGAARGLATLVSGDGDCRGRVDLHHAAPDESLDLVGEVGDLQYPCRACHAGGRPHRVAARA